MQILINIDVPDVERGIAFYTALGLRLTRRLFDGTVAELAAGPVRIHLLPAPGASTTAMGAATRDYARHWTPVHLDLCVDDLDAALARATAAGATLEGAVRKDDWGSIATLADPFGHGLCLIQLSARGYDHVAS